MGFILVQYEDAGGLGKEEIVGKSGGFCPKPLKPSSARYPRGDGGARPNAGAGVPVLVVVSQARRQYLAECGGVKRGPTAEGGRGPHSVIQPPRRPSQVDRNSTPMWSSWAWSSPDAGNEPLHHRHHRDKRSSRKLCL
ncbi:hypothetical protein, unlikely [Trypanosoma congolense IL3000]|uniref:Uncharacterized protein n=1 Tax=Trypanosoma congolense (strain IL3000) TaxID=1068625 RepID=F9W4E0_TRYCI|nr:hypothetical protein, unlikely [Trypanosoma congolense IL3000]